jgi:hypothetical protein
MELKGEVQCGLLKYESYDNCMTSRKKPLFLLESMKMTEMLETALSPKIHQQASSLTNSSAQHTAEPTLLLDARVTSPPRTQFCF